MILPQAEHAFAGGVAALLVIAAPRTLCELRKH